MPDRLYCAAPFRSIRLDSQNSRTAFRPCCAYQNQLPVPEILENYLASTELGQLQAHFRDNQGEWPSGCAKCQAQESHGQESLRDYFNRKFTSENKRYTRLEVLPSNVCNLRCVMCDEQHSTALAQERRRLGWIQEIQSIDLEDQCQQTMQDMPDIDTVSFIGGEFFLSRQNLQILDVAIQRNLAVELTTNASLILESQIEKLQKVRELELQISIDGIDHAYDFMRYPAKWHQVEHNIRILRERLPTARFRVIFVIQPMNLQHLIPTMDYFNRARMPMNLHELQKPNWLGWQILTAAEGRALAQVLSQQRQRYQLTRPQLQRIINYENMLDQISTDPQQRQEFVQRLHATTAHRDISADTIKQHFGVLTQLASDISSR